MFSREWRFITRHASSSFYTGNKGSLFATNKSSCTLTNRNEDIYTTVHNITSKHPIIIRLLQSIFHPFKGQIVFSTNIDISLPCSYCICCNCNTFNYPMWISLNDSPVHKCSRIAFIGITDHKFFIISSHQCGSPFLTSGIPTTTSSFESGFFDNRTNVIRSIISNSLDKSTIPSTCNIFNNILRVDDTTVLQNNTILIGKERNLVNEWY